MDSIIVRRMTPKISEHISLCSLVIFLLVSWYHGWDRLWAHPSSCQKLPGVLSPGGGGYKLSPPGLDADHLLHLVPRMITSRSYTRTTTPRRSRSLPLSVIL